MSGIALDFLRALALVLVIEGVLPFIAPGRYRNLMSRMQSLDDRQVRASGLVIMICGLLGLQLIHWFL